MRTTIKDLRLYRGDQLSEYDAYSLCLFADKKLTATVFRIAMKLREQGFSMGDYDHLYIVFIPCDTVEGFTISQEVDRYHPWYRKCFVRVKQDVYEHLENANHYAYLLDTIGKLLVSCYANDRFGADRILECIHHAVELGEDMLMEFKEKRSTNRHAIIYLRYRDTCCYSPLLRVWDLNGTLLLEADLPEAITLDYLGEIQLSANRVKIKPRKNAFSANLEPLTFEY